MGALAETAPVGKVLSMLSDLQAKIIQEGDAAQKEYAEFAEMCEDRSRDLGFEIKTGKGEVENLKTTIAEQAATLVALTTKVEELNAALATNNADLKAASWIRSKEVKDFTAEEKELMETIDMLGRATSILEQEMSKGGSALLQSRSAGNLASTFDVMVRASMIGTSEAARLTVLVQDAQRAKDSDDDQAPGAPAAAVYESQSGNIVETLQDLSEKAESQLADTRKKETAARHNFEMLKQSLESEGNNAAEDMEGAKKAIAESSEKKATLGGELDVTSKELAADIKVKGSLHVDCLSKASAFEAETKSRGEELKALADAKAIIEKATGGAFGQLSLVQ